MQTMYRHDNRSGGIVLASLLVIMAFLTILMSAVFSMLASEEQTTAAHSRSTICFFAADAGIDRTISILRASPNWNSGFTEEPLKDTDDNIIGYYTVTVDKRVDEAPWVRVTVTSTGMLPSKEARYRRSIEAQILVANPAQFFAFTPDKFFISDGADIKSNVFAYELELSLNPALGKGITIGSSSQEANAYYVDKITENDYNGAAAPNIVIYGDKIKSGPVAFPAIDVDYYRDISKSGGSYHSAGVTFSDGIDDEDLGEDGNGLIFAEKEVYIEGEISVPVTIVSAADIYITGNITWAEDADGNPTGKLGLFAKNDIYIHKDAPGQEIRRPWRYGRSLSPTEAASQRSAQRGPRTNLYLRGLWLYVAERIQSTEQRTWGYMG